MDTTIVALKNLYVALGGSAADVADVVIIPDMINAIATVAGAVKTAVTASDDGKVLKVVDGAWAVGADAIE